MPLKTDITLWILIGLPGSGKSTFAKCFSSGAPPLQLISTDQIRGDLFGDESTQGPWPPIWKHVTQEFQQVVFRVHQGTLAGAIYDATNAQRRGRRAVIQAARQAGFNRLLAIWLDMPITVCLDRNQRRSRQVPKDVIQAMARKLTGAPPHCDEGFDAVYRIHPTETILGQKLVWANK